MTAGIEAWRLMLAVVILLGIAWVPGIALHRLLLAQRSRAEALAAAPALSAGLLYALGEVLSSLDLAVDSRLAFGLAAAGSAALLWRRSTLQGRVDRMAAYAVAGGATLGAAIWSLGVQHWRAVPPHNDGYNHGFFVRRIAETHSLSPGDVMPHDVLLGGHGVDYYPLALHQQAAVLVQVLHLDVATAWTLTALSTPVVALPLGFLVLGRLLFPDLRRVTATSALVAAVVPGVTYSTSWWGGYALAAGFAVTAGAIAVLLHAAQSLRAPAVIIGAIALTGVAGVHTSEYSFACVLVGVLVSVSALEALSLRTLLTQGTSLAVTVLGSLVLLGPAVLQLHRGLDERAYPVPTKGLPLGRAIGEVLVQHSFVPPATPVVIPLAALVGLSACARSRRARGWLTAWVVFALLYVWLAAYPSAFVTSLTATWYSDRFRIGYILAFVTVPLVAYAIAGGSRAPRREVRLVGPVLGIVLLVTSASASVHAIRKNYRDFSLVGADERAAFSFLAAHVGPDEHVVNQHQDGSPWMYSLDEVAPLVALKTFDFDRPEWRDANYLARHVQDAGSDPEVDRLLSLFRARYVYVGPDVFPTEDADLDRAALQGSSRLRLVFSRGRTQVYEVRG
jgi:hypothetical protein